MNLPLRPLMQSQDLTNLIHNTPKTLEGIFASNSIGHFLADGQWPQTCAVEIDGLTIRVASSDVCLKWQEVSQSDDVLYKVRITMDIAFQTATQSRTFHLEDLFPISTLEVLQEPLNMDEAIRRIQDAVQQALKEPMRIMPIEQAMSSCLIPMRVYEPILDALLTPATEDSMASFLQHQLPSMLIDEEHPFLAFEDEQQRIEFSILECHQRHSMRTPNALKLVGHVSWCFKDGECQQGAWRSRGMLLTESISFTHQPAPTLAAQEAFVTQWRAMIQQTIASIADDGFQPIRLKQLLAKVPFESVLV